LRVFLAAELRQVLQRHLRQLGRKLPPSSAVQKTGVNVTIARFQYYDVVQVVVLSVIAGPTRSTAVGPWRISK
jgi:hypothetical protein